MHSLIRAAVVAAFFVSASTAPAQSQCGPREILLRQLAERYGEAPIAHGVMHNGRLLEVIADRHGRTWSIVVTSPQGLSCLVAAGEGWRAVEPEPEVPEA